MGVSNLYFVDNEVKVFCQLNVVNCTCSRSQSPISSFLVDEFFLKIAFYFHRVRGQRSRWE
jgi:hypothetical protein